LLRRHRPRVVHDQRPSPALLTHRSHVPGQAFDTILGSPLDHSARTQITRWLVRTGNQMNETPY
jgi:hypothetical protein